MAKSNDELLKDLAHRKAQTEQKEREDKAEADRIAQAIEQRRKRQEDGWNRVCAIFNEEVEHTNIKLVPLGPRLTFEEDITQRDHPQPWILRFIGEIKNIQASYQLPVCPRLDESIEVSIYNSASRASVEQRAYEDADMITAEEARSLINLLLNYAVNGG